MGLSLRRLRRPSSLYVSHATKAVVVDIAKDVVVGEIADTPGIHGAIRDDARPASSRATAAQQRQHRRHEKLEDDRKGGKRKGIPIHPVRPKQKEVYTFNGAGKSATVIGAESGKVVRRSRSEASPRRLWPIPAEVASTLNIEDRSTLAVIDVATHAGRSPPGRSRRVKRHPASRSTRSCIGCSSSRATS